MNPQDNQFPDKKKKFLKNKRYNHLYKNYKEHDYHNPNDKYPDHDDDHNNEPPNTGGARVPRKPIKPSGGGEAIRTVSIDPNESLINPPPAHRYERQV